MSDKSQSRAHLRGAKPALVERADVEPLRAHIAELESRLSRLESEYRDQLDENESLGRVLDADDKLAAATAEAKRFREQVRLLQERINGLIGECDQAVRMVKSLQRKLAAS